MTALDSTLDAHVRTAEAFSALLRGAPGEKRVPHLEWNVGELGAHVLGGMRAYAAAARDGVEVWRDVRDGTAENARLLDEVPERDTTAIADAIPGAIRTLHAAWRGADASAVTWSGGLRIPLEVAAGLEFADVLVHGWDLATTLGREWLITTEDAARALRAAFAVAPHFVAPSASRFTGTFEIRFRGNGSETLAFDRGTLRVGEKTARPDCRLHANPRALLLTAYGRVPVWRSALTGGIVVSGRKPWLGLRFKSLLLSP